MTKKTLRRLPPTTREIAKALGEIQHGLRVIDRLLGPKAPRQGLMNLAEMEIMAMAVRDAMPKTNRRKATKTEAAVCPEHGARLHPACEDCAEAWEKNGLAALKINVLDKAFGE